MDRSERKAAVSAYKERKAVAGVYAIRCAATDGQWVGAAPDLSTIWTRRSFALRQGVETNQALQSAWNIHGPRKFRLQDPRRDRSRATDLWARACPQGAGSALARNVGRRGRDLTFPRVPVSYQKPTASSLPPRPQERAAFGWNRHRERQRSDPLPDGRLG